MKKPCKECPHIIRNRHNDMIVDFGKRTGKSHNCHMTEGVKDLWNIKDKKFECYGAKQTIDWLKTQFEKDSDTTFYNLNWDKFDELFEQAKKMNKLEKEMEYRRGFQDGKQYYMEEYGRK